MAIFTIADLHLSKNQKTDKSMEKFGPHWVDYMDRLEKNWRAVVSEEDYVICPGDISWAMTLEEAKEDLAFLHALPGKKLIGKGNHDFWWSTNTKLTRFFAESGFDSLQVLHNNAYLLPEAVICGARGWFLDRSMQNTVAETDFDKISAREVGRMEISLSLAAELRERHERETGTRLPLLAFLHFPPVWAEFSCEPLLSLMRAYDVQICAFGHVHNLSVLPAALSAAAPPQMLFCAADYLQFLPKRIL